MIKTNGLLKILVIGVCLMFYGMPSAFSDDVTTGTSVNGDSPEVTHGYGAGSSSSGGSSSSSGGGSSGTGTGTGTGEESNPEDYNYSNLYNGYKLLPEAMVMYCKFNAEDAVKDLNIITECIKKYAKAMNNSNVAYKAEAMHEYDVMRMQALNLTLSEATAMLSSIKNFDDVTKKYNQAGNKPSTEYDMSGVITASHSFSTKVINDIRKLYAEDLKYRAIDGIGNIDPTAILSEEEAEASKNASVEGSASHKIKGNTISSNTVIEGPVSGDGTGGASGDGTGGSSAKDSAAGDESGNPENGSQNQGNEGSGKDAGENETGQPDNTNAYAIENRAQELYGMDPDDLVNHGAELDSLLAQAQEEYNNPNLTPSDRAVLERTISDLEGLIDEVSETRANYGSAAGEYQGNVDSDTGR